jgi:peptidoglycan L-alanyl-D-glutamate endopeptidase CwlK
VILLCSLFDVKGGYKMANITDQCRDTKQLNELCATLLDLAFSEIKKNGINPLLVETYRTQARQAYLYSQGRTVKGAVVTWTLDSIHTLRNAVDVVPQRVVDGKITAIWNSNDKQTLKLIEIMTKYGFESGANWNTSKDSPHFQIKGVSTTGKEYHAKNNNVYITKMIQLALNKYLGIHLLPDGKWGSLTTAAVNDFRAKNKWSKNGKLGVIALKELLKNY